MAIKVMRLEQRTQDISDRLFQKALLHGRVACDIETSGLDWNVDDIATCQVEVDGEVALVQLDPTDRPSNISKLMESSRVRKVFHHAPFDLRFMVSKWGISPVNVACTKIAAKIVRPGLSGDAYSLKSSLRTYLNVEIDKSPRMSNWSEAKLSAEQVEYAIGDVLYLNKLLSILEARAEMLGVARLVKASYAYLPARVELDMRGPQDVFTY
jgi:ribonuclease D